MPPRTMRAVEEAASEEVDEQTVRVGARVITAGGRDPGAAADAGGDEVFGRQLEDSVKAAWRDIEKRAKKLPREAFAKRAQLKKDAKSGAMSSPGGERPDTYMGVIQGAVVPMYDSDQLCMIVEHSNSLRQNVDAYATNIDGFGHRFEPVINLEADNADEKIADVIRLERILGAVDGKLSKDKKSGLPIAPDKEPTAKEIADRKKVLEVQLKTEHFKLTQFFESAVVDESFVALRRKTRVDRETTGNAFWEVIRDGAGRPCQFVFMPARTVRLIPREVDSIEASHYVQTGPLTLEKQSIKRKFRRFVQISDGVTVYFKELGDPRAISSKTGAVYRDVPQLNLMEPGVPAANEAIHFAVHSPRSPYGVPRWIGNLLSVLGSRQCEEVNFLYFENKSIPPLAILVSGGRMSESSVQRIRDFIDTEVKGKKNFHKVLILEAEAADVAAQMGLENAGKMRIEIKPLTESHLKDALFQEYDERNIDKVGMGFRLPRLLRGDTRDFNRATAEAALEFAESQVFAPERQEFDHMMNRVILPELGVSLWKYHSNGIKVSDPEAIAKMLQLLGAAGALTPRDMREVAGDLVFSKEFPQIDAPWVDQPIALSVAGINENTEFFPTGVDDPEDQDDNEIPGKKEPLPEEDGADAPPAKGGKKPPPPPGKGKKPPAGDEAPPAKGGKKPPVAARAAAKKRLIAAATRILKVRDALAEAEREDVVDRFRRSLED